MTGGATGWRLITRGTWYVLAALVAILVVVQVRSVVVQSILAMIISASVSPLADGIIQSTVIQRWRWKPGRAIIVLVVYLVLAVLALTLCVVLAGSLTDQIDAFLASLPQYTAALEQWIAGTLPGHLSPGVANTLQALGVWVLGTLGEFLTGLTMAVSGLVGDTLGLVFTLILGVYFAADGERMQRFLLEYVPALHRPRAARVVDVGGRRLGAWVRGQLAVSSIIGLIFGVGLALIGVPYALMLGVIAFLGEFVPLVGPFISSVPAIIVAFIAGGQTLGLVTIVFCIVVEQLECDLIVPRVMGSATSIHPVAVMLAILAGAQLGGATGALLAVPIAGFASVLLDELRPTHTTLVPFRTDIGEPADPVVGSIER
jgi:predicted PurR-regulated permease PerM